MKRCLILFIVISLFFSISCGSSSSSISVPKSFNMISSVPAASRLNSNKDLVMVRSNANKIEDAKDKYNSIIQIRLGLKLFPSQIKSTLYVA